MPFLLRGVSQPALYDALASSWWGHSGVLHGLGVLLDPVRVPFVRSVLRTHLGSSGGVLDLGAGGGSVSVAISDDNHRVIAVDPSLLSLQAGRAHARATGSRVGFVGATGERLPFGDGSFDAVVCMEVLEHVDDAAAVVGEAARVLRPGGIFIFSCPNRTWLNRLGLLLVAQHLLGLIPRGTHRWSRLLRPSDMERRMRDSGIEPTEIVGVGVRARSIPRLVTAALGLLLRRLTYPEAAQRIDLVAGTSTIMAYQGFGIRHSVAPAGVSPPPAPAARPDGLCTKIVRSP